MRTRFTKKELAQRAAYKAKERVFYEVDGELEIAEIGAVFSKRFDPSIWYAVIANGRVFHVKEGDMRGRCPAGRTDREGKL